MESFIYSLNCHAVMDDIYKLITRIDMMKKTPGVIIEAQPENIQPLFFSLSKHIPLFLSRNFLEAPPLIYEAAKTKYVLPVKGTVPERVNGCSPNMTIAFGDPDKSNGMLSNNNILLLNYINIGCGEENQYLASQLKHYFLRL
jgi:hypothetical protein